MNKKYLAIILVVILAFMFGNLMFEQYQQGQCRQVALQSGKSVEEINRICR